MTLIWSIFDAVEASDLRAPLRWFLVELTRCADETGYGYTGQDTLAAKLGCSKREVIRMFAETDRLGWTHRQRRHGSGGRTSDGYWVHVPQGASLSPDNQSPDSRSRDNHDRGKVTSGHFQGDRLSQDLPSDLPSDLPRGSAHAPATPPPSAPTAPPLTLDVQEPAPRGRGGRKPKADTTPGHSEVKDHYVSAFEKRRGVKPIFDGAEGTAVKRLLGKLHGDVDHAKQIITNALESWKGDSVTILQIARDPSAFAAAAPAKTNGRRAPEPQPAAKAGGWKPRDLTAGAKP